MKRIIALLLTAALLTAFGCARHVQIVRGDPKDGGKVLWTVANMPESGEVTYEQKTAKDQSVKVKVTKKGGGWNPLAPIFDFVKLLTAKAVESAEVQIDGD